MPGLCQPSAATLSCHWAALARSRVRPILRCPRHIASNNDATWVHVKAVTRSFAASTKVSTSYGDHRFLTHNYHPIVEDRDFCHTSDVLSITRIADQVHAGGHHSDDHVEPLPAGASFSQRAEFAQSTHGWAASDEFLACLGLLQQRIQSWQPGHVEFEEGPFGEMHFAPVGRSCLILLVGAHWALVEVNRSENGVRVAINGLPQQLAQRVAMIMCRLMDVPSLTGLGCVSALFNLPLTSVGGPISFASSQGRPLHKGGGPGLLARSKLPMVHPHRE